VKRNTQDISVFLFFFMARDDSFPAGRQLRLKKF